MQKRMVVLITTCLSLLIFAAVGHAEQNETLTPADYIQIQQLYARYNDAIDSGNADAFATTFTPDGSFNDLHGHDALVGFVHYWRHKMNGTNMRHWNTNLVINPASQGATGSVYLMLINVGVKPPVIALAAKYHDQLVKTPDGWKFERRVTTSEAPPQAAAAPKD
jgi:SnoaL-like domain